MPKDLRTKREKLRDMASAQLSSPFEAAEAQRILANLPPPRTLTAADILATPSTDRGKTVRVYDQRMGAYLVMDEADY